jgi:hypothetical protein
MPSVVPERFREIVDAMKEHQKLAGEGLHNTEQRPWMDFQDIDELADNFDLAALYQLFNIQEANTTYIQAREQEDAEEHKITVPKLAADFLMSVARDMDMRRRSRVRMMVHAGVRYRVGGKDGGDGQKGPFEQMTLGFLNALENPKKVGPQE